MATMARDWLRRLLLPRKSEARTVRFGILRGVKLFLDPQSGLQNQYGLAERELHPWFRKFSKDIQTAVDLGAAEGDYTLFYLLKTRAKHVFAFDYKLRRLAVLYQNLEVNGLMADPRLEVVEAFVGASVGNDVSLDEFIDRFETPLLIKMDVERGEHTVLENCPRLLALRDVRWIIEVHSAKLDLLCRELLEKNGYKVTNIYPAWWRRWIREERGDYVRWLAAEK